MEGILYLFTGRREKCLYDNKQNEIGQKMCLIPDCTLEVPLSIVPALLVYITFLLIVCQQFYVISVLGHDGDAIFIS